ncbi:unnamed protein product [Dibothriocephalus latus]|uniref:Uncharacterized protein n=1 Tax=Dibothriocephalus latus TaxID=60516 RepID=A0A3P7NV20_DIBLA|nr:unnamed protein product [Dibothriocephalus latus]
MMSQREAPSFFTSGGRIGMPWPVHVLSSGNGQTAGEGDTNRFTDIGPYNRGRPTTAGVAGLATPQTKILGAVIIERDQVLMLQESVSSVFPDIQLTMEEAENNQLAFLDVLVYRKDCGGLKAKVSTKASNTMHVLNYSGNQP